MKIFKIAEKASNFLIRRFIELFGLLIVFASIFLFLSLLSYVPEDPNFIFPENTLIKNFFGIQGKSNLRFVFSVLGVNFNFN